MTKSGKTLPPPVRRILRYIPSKILRYELRRDPPELTTLQWASVAAMIFRPRTLAGHFAVLEALAETAFERELLAAAVRDIGAVGYVDAQAQAVYRTAHDEDTVPYFPFLERCRLPVLLRAGDPAKCRRGRRWEYFLVGRTPEDLPAASDFSDESYLVYDLDCADPSDLFAAHEHLHVCFADACGEEELTAAQRETLRRLRRMAAGTVGSGR